MRQVDRVAGDIASRLNRAGAVLRVLTAAACLVPAACAELESVANSTASGAAAGSTSRQPIASAAAWLVAQPPLIGGTLVAATNSSGMPRQGARRGYLKLAQPIAVAAWGPDVYVVDSANGALFRFDSTTQSVVRIAPVRPLMGTRLVAAPDGSAYLLQPGLPGIKRYARDGRLITTYAAPADLVHPVDMVIEPSRGLLWVADGTLEQIVAFHPMGRIAYIVGQRGNPDSRLASGLGQMAAGERSVFVTDPECRCVGEVQPQGQGLRIFGEGELVRPTAVAADRWGRVWVVDAGDWRIKVFFDDLLAASATFRDLNLSSVEAMSIHENDLYLADAQSGRIAVFRIVQPAVGAARP